MHAVRQTLVAVVGVVLVLAGRFYVTLSHGPAPGSQVFQHEVTTLFNSFAKYIFVTRKELAAGLTHYEYSYKLRFR